MQNVIKKLEILPPGYKFWLNDASNLITALNKYYIDVKVKKISQKRARLTAFEKNYIKADGAQIRKIFIHNDRRNIVFARTVISDKLYHALRNDLELLGDQPIGDILLFNNDSFKRSKFIIRKLTRDDFIKETTLETTFANIYSRSSIFVYKENKEKLLIITEYFLELDEMKHYVQ